MDAEGIRSSKRPRRDNDERDAEVSAAGSLHPWQNASSRIIRVSRVSGGKDRHSKVWTVKGLRDRRVRLSVSTSIQFYDLQDRLGYDQPSKAVDWLIKAAASAIVDLPELEGPFPAPPSLALPGRAILAKPSGSKSTGSSASEISKCSELVKEKENNGSSFNGLLNNGAIADFNSSFDQKQFRRLPPISTSDYFRQTETFGQTHRIPQFEPTFSSLLHYPHMGMGTMTYSATVSGEHQDIHQFSFLQDHVPPVPEGDSDHNVSVTSGIAGFSRGTLQSNLPHQHHFVHGANFPFFLSATPPTVTVGGGNVDNQFPGDFNSRLHLFCDEGHRLSELKRERKG